MANKPQLEDMLPHDDAYQSLAVKYAGNGHDPRPPADLILELLCDEIPRAGVHIAFDEQILDYLRDAETQQTSLFHATIARLMLSGVPKTELLNAVHARPKPPPDLSTSGHETLTELLAAEIPPAHYLLHDLLHEGMLLFGGKSKRGKSWLMFDLAISVATGRHAFRYAGFANPEPRPVLYLALEDGRARLQARAKAIQQNLQTVDNFHIRWEFPPLAQGGMDLLVALIEKYHYGLVVIDVLAKLEPVGSRGDKSYYEVYQMFGPLQALRAKHAFCLAMLTHLRKQEAEDHFENIHGSVAYQGAQDVLWVLERKPKDDYAFLHVRDKDAEDKTYALRFVEGHWEYIGEGESYELSRDQRKVMKVLQEEQENPAGMSIQEILKACEMPDAKYGYMRKLLVTMVAEDLIHRTQRGRYTGTLSGAYQMREPGEDDDEVF